ncbi:hypothetical protein FJTKL_00903 [Diaporthe vaccinii]|uniref:O-methyltransferase C-terminal domain-containing protein n=1 Tax=Diaporthe vaccinii TaxID=105482 RepID=A0ABR4E220_9PEZI
MLGERVTMLRYLIVRIMRPLAITGVVVELGPKQYEANLATRFFASQGIAGGCKYYTDLIMRTGSHMGSLAAQGEVSDPFQATFGMPLFEYFQEHREYGEAFEDFMSVRQSKSSKWFDVYPVRARMEEARTDESNVLLVDVGGGSGHWAQEFRSAMPAQEYRGRVVVQDQPSVVSRIQLDGVEAMAYDFFTPQPIEGARFYLFKQVIHDWDDKKAIEILRNTAQSMIQDQSTLLIDDYVLPEENVGLQATCMDIGMMMANGGCERTETQWQNIISAAGLKIKQFWFSGDGKEGSAGVIECQI